MANKVKQYSRNYYNMQDISNDNIKAKAAGLSYGKYKAHIGLDYEESEYAVCSGSYLTPTKPKSSGTTKAFIRVK